MTENDQKEKTGHSRKIFGVGERKDCRGQRNQFHIEHLLTMLAEHQGRHVKHEDEVLVGRVGQK